VQLGRDPNPGAGIVDSQSIKTTGVGGNERGFDPAKKVDGRKRHLLVDTEGLVLEVRLHSAKVPDQDGIRLLLERAQGRFARLSHLWVDAGYQVRGRDWVQEVLGLRAWRSCASPASRSPRRWPRSGPGSGPRRYGEAFDPRVGVSRQSLDGVSNLQHPHSGFEPCSPAHERRSGVGQGLEPDNAALDHPLEVAWVMNASVSKVR